MTKPVLGQRIDPDQLQASGYRVVITQAPRALRDSGVLRVLRICDNEITAAWFHEMPEEAPSPEKELET